MPQTLESHGPGNPAPNAGFEAGKAWFCLRSQPKHEHIAVAHLRKDVAIDAFAPRIRFRRLTKRGAVWVTEALFPSYFFAQFDPVLSFRRVNSCLGVRGIVHFGDRWPVIPASVIEDLRAAAGGDEVRVVSSELRPGEDVQFAGGALHGLTAVVTRVMSGTNRIAVLMDFLGRQTVVEVAGERVVKVGNWV